MAKSIRSIVRSVTNRSIRVGSDFLCFLSGTAGYDYPHLHPAIIADYVKDTPNAHIDLFPVRFDIKQAEVLATLFLDGTSTRIASAPHAGAIPVFMASHRKFSEDFCRNAPEVSIVFDLHDGEFGSDAINLSHEVCRTIHQRQLQVIYLKLQIHDPSSIARLNPLPDAVHVLSLPLLPGGSRFHITCQEDFIGDRRFRLNLAANPLPTYLYDWSWIGGGTCDDRHHAFELLSPHKKRPRFFTITQPGHPEANQATVPIDKYLEVCRGSKICISLNGNGPWCLKDGELLANSCLVLRQFHPILSLNPLSPRDSEHWFVAKTEDLIGTMEHLLEHPEERERVRIAGHNYLCDALINRTWAKYHTRLLRAYLETRTKNAWGQLAIG